MAPSKVFEQSCVFSTSIRPLRSLTILLVLCSTASATVSAQEVTERDPYLLPFSADSIWNTPIGSEAEYVPAKIVLPEIWAITADEEIIITTPDAPVRPVYVSGARFTRDEDRCENNGEVLTRLPIPNDFRTFPRDKLTANHGAAVIKTDGVTFFSNPTARGLQ